MVKIRKEGKEQKQEVRPWHSNSRRPGKRRGKGEEKGRTKIVGALEAK